MPDYQNIAELLKLRGIPQKELYVKLGVTRQYFGRQANSDEPSPKFVRSLIELKPELAEYLSPENGLRKVYIEDSNATPQRTPFYDLDFTAGFLEVLNNQTTHPDSFITHPFFSGCDFVVRASGQSMAKIIKHGDLIGLRRVEAWQDFIPFGEVYAIVTVNGLRMVKIITAGETEDSFTLLSKPSESKKEEFPPQQIKKKHIMHIYKVHASSHLF